MYGFATGVFENVEELVQSLRPTEVDDEEYFRDLP